MTRNNWLKRDSKYIYSYDYPLQETLGGAFQPERLSCFMSREDVQREIHRTSDSISKLLEQNENKIYIPILADTHYCENGNWEYTARTVEEVMAAVSVQEKRKPDMIIHLGDFTDGILSKEICRKYSGSVLDRIKSWGCPMTVAVGNHDANYFKKNPDLLTDKEQYKMYLENYCPNEDRKLYYKTTCKNITIFVLSAYKNDEENRYGYDAEQLDWLEDELQNTNQKVLVLSHDAPMTRLDYWAKEIRNGERLCKILNDNNKDDKIIGFIFGHIHADLVNYENTFPAISIPCNKMEYFEKYKPEGAVANARYEDEVTQEQWDTLVIDTDANVINIIRFGAGQDRKIDKKNIYNPKIWAHRGASGYAPENTLEAFKLAIDMQAEGIELDVQYTKDRKIVVIHDEYIDRTSNGTGAVADHTLEELKKLVFNKTHPKYGETRIPTLEEVLELLAPTRLELNIELKTSVNYYPGIERETIELVHKYNMQDRVIYSSFNHESIKRVKAIEPEASCGFLYSEGIADVAEYCKKYQVEAAHPYFKALRYPGFREECRDAGIKIHTWTVNEEKDMEQLRQYEVEAIITNYPDRARRVYYGEKLTYKAPAAKEEKIQKKNPILHAMGITYKYVRKPFVTIDRFVQGAAKR